MSRDCHICGEDNDVVLERHHIIPDRYGGSDEPENLATLCANCHRAIENLYGDEFYDRLIEQIQGREWGVADPSESVSRFVREELEDNKVLVPKGTNDGTRAELFEQYCEFCESKRLPRHTSRRRFFAEVRASDEIEYVETI